MRGRTMLPRILALPAAAVAGLLLAGGCTPAGSAATAAQPMPGGGKPHVAAASQVDAGEYLTVLGGCNDCHTEGWAEQNGQVPDAQRLTGVGVGYRGPWGTTYPANLRLVVQNVSADRWVEILTTADGGRGRPPMPWMNTARMSDADLRAMYEYIHSLGPAGERAPRSLPPGQEPTTPYIWMVPQRAGAPPT
ncbi:MAG TPA: c-type cytochrome [Longimicrobiaceae bacterium]|nr:c-type cytochrome [Longimicrobiaceae bacterium]